MKDIFRPSFGRPFFACSEKGNPCSFWQWGDVIRPQCYHVVQCSTRKVTKEGVSHGRLFYACSKGKDDACGYFEWRDTIRAVARTLIEGGGCIFIYSGSARLVSFEMKLISKEVSRAEPEYMNIHTPINALATALDTIEDEDPFEPLVNRLTKSTCQSLKTKKTREA